MIEKDNIVVIKFFITKLDSNILSESKRSQGSATLNKVKVPVHKRSIKKYLQ